MTKVKWFDRPFQGCPTKWTLCTTEEEYHRAQRSAGLTRNEQMDWCLSEHSKMGAVTHFEDRVILVCAPLFSGYSVLVHEAVHVYQHMMHDIGEGSPGEEMQAYGIEFIAETLINAMAEREKASKPKRRPKCTK